MADNRQEIERLRKKIEQANKDIRDIKRQSDIKLQQEIDRMQKQMHYSSSKMQSDFAEKLQSIQDTFSEAYLAETERMRTRYLELMGQVKAYEAELDSAIQNLERQQDELIRANEKKNQQYRQLAIDAIAKLQKDIEEACTLPVEVFYPHSMQKYLDAGLEAKRLLESELYSLAIAKSDCAAMSVNRVKEETKTKIDELNAMFRLYKLKLDSIEEFLLQTDNRCLFEDGNVVLELSECDMDYWSDFLFSELQLQLEQHRDTIESGTENWIRRCDGQALEPSYLLDKEIQKLDLIPEKLGICISYALSACDCFNYTHEIASIAEEILNGQNYELVDIAYGVCKYGNDDTEGFNYYYQNYLINEQCVCSGKTPDYREERVLTFRKRHLSGSDSEYCKIYIVPFRKEKTVAFRVYLQLESTYIPKMMCDSLIHLFEKNGLNIQIAENSCSLGTTEQRPLSLQRITDEGLANEEARLENKYSASY